MRRSIPAERANGGEDMKERERERERQREIELWDGRKGRGLLNLFATCEHECSEEEGVREKERRGA